MKTLRTETIINASSETVWNNLMSHKDYPTWNPFIKSISGNIKEGSIIDVQIQSGPDKEMQFKPTVLVLEKEKEFRWLGHLFVKGLFDGEHYFKLESLGPNKTRFIHGENFKGILSTVLLKMIGENTKIGFESMNYALKSISEKN